MDLSDSDSVEPEWKKVERDMKKVGLKNGLSDGRDSNYQSSFDKGYADGFESGFRLGKLRFQRSNCKNLATSDWAELLESASTGLCIICSSEEKNEDVADVRKKQCELVSSKIENIERDLNRQ